MKKLLIILALLVPFWVLAQNRPLVDADLLDGFDSQFFLDTLDFDVTKTWYVDVNYDDTCWSCPVSNGTILAPFTAIQQAFDSCSVGDIVLVYPGTYPAEHLHPIIDSIDLRSVGGASQTFVALTASGGTGFDMDSEGMTIDGFYFTGDAGFLIQLEGGEDGFTLKNCVIDTEGTPSIGLNIGASGCSNMIVENNKFISQTDNGAIWMDKNISNPLIRNNWFVGADSTVSYAIQTAGSTGGRYLNNLIEGYNSGIFLHTSTSSSSGTANELIANNIIRNCGNGIRLGHNTQTVDMDSIFVFNNTLYYNSFAIFIADDANVLSGTFEVVANNINDNTISIRNNGDVPVYLANWINGTLVAATLNTGQGDNELYAMDQDVQTTDDPTFNTVTLTDQSTEATYDIINNSELQNSLVGSYYNFTTDDYIEVADNDDLDFGTGDFSQTIRFRLNTVSGTQYLQNKEAGGVGYGIYLIDDDILIRFDDNNADASAIILTAKIVVDTWYSLSIAFDRDGNASANLNGTITGTVDISGTNLTISNVGNYRLGSTTAGGSFFDGYIAYNLIWNRLLTSSELEKISRWSSDVPPVLFRDIGGNNTELIIDGGFDDAAKWDAFGGATVDDGGNSNAILSGATTGVWIISANPAGLFTIVSGDYYQITYTVVSNNLDAGDLSTGTISGAENFPSQVIPQIVGVNIITIKADGSGADSRWTFSIDATSTSGAITISDISIMRAGVVADYNGSGIGHNTWMDASGNDLYGTVNGATYTNIPASDIEEARQDGISGDTQILSSSNLVPDGYVLKYVIGTETAGNTATLDLGTSAGGSQVFSQQVFTASTVTPVAVDFFNLTGSDIALYINDDGAGTWNSGELDFIFVIQKIR